MKFPWLPFALFCVALFAALIFVAVAFATGSWR